MTRDLVTVETVLSISPIPDADSIEAAQVRGWTVVVRKGEFTAGDLVVFFEVDSALPLADERFAFLADRGTKTYNDRQVHVLKTARLRGVYSQGLVLPFGDFPEFERDEFDDFAGALGVTLYDPPLPAGMNAAGPFPAFLRKTDAERVQNIDDETWAEILGLRFDWDAVEKIDGSSLTAWKEESDILRVASRNWELTPGENAHWRAAAPYADLLRPGQWLQGEVAGPGVQGNPLKLDKVRLFIFGFGTLGVLSPLPLRQWPTWAFEARPPRHHALELPETPVEAAVQVDRLQSLVAPGRQAEGVVWTNIFGNEVSALGRHLFKAINANYLLKHDR